jgi:hypothetical protein
MSRVMVPVVLALGLSAGCKSDEIAACCVPVPSGLVVVNGFGVPVDVTVDGHSVASALAPGEVARAAITPGMSHTVSLRVTGVGTTSDVSFMAGATGAPAAAVAALRLGGGTLSAQSLTDTNAIVPAGATKMRVLHLAANAGEVQVWRTQPDFMTPIRWAFPFTYNTANVYYQSAVGTWDVRIWTDTSTYAPGNMTPWAALALDQMQVALTSGARGTVAIVDKPGGGVKLVRLE